MPLFQRLTVRVKSKIWSKLRWVEAALCQHEVVLPYIMSSLVPLHGCWPRSQEGWRKPLHFPVLTCLPQGSHSHPRSFPQPCCLQGSRGEQPAACRNLHPFPKDLQDWMQSSKHHPAGIVLSVAIPFSHSSTVGWEHHWQLFSNLSMLLSYPGFSTVWYKDMWCSLLPKLTFFFFSFSSLFLGVLIPKS